MPKDGAQTDAARMPGDVAAYGAVVVVVVTAAARSVAHPVVARPDAPVPGLRELPADGVQRSPDAALLARAVGGQVIRPTARARIAPRIAAWGVAPADVRPALNLQGVFQAAFGLSRS